MKQWRQKLKMWNCVNYIFGTSVDYWVVITKQGEVHHPACFDANSNHNTNLNLNPNPNSNPTAYPN